MRVYRSLSEAESNPAGDRPVVSVGFFDGLHRGHQLLLDDLLEWASDVDGAPVVLTFDTHPQLVVRGSAPPVVLSLDHRLLLLERSGVAAALVLPFDETTSQWSPEEFVERVIVRALHSRRLLLGFDSTVGHRRLGTYEYLAERSSSTGVEVRQSEAFFLDGERISSTLVRLAVTRGDLERVEALTGRPYAVLGEVVHGDHRGRQIGFPTANLRIDAEAVAPGGVYFARVDAVVPPGAEGAVAAPGDPPSLRDAPALVNIGRRPTFTGEATDPRSIQRFDPALDRIEAHVLDFDGDLYGVTLEVRLLARHRGERKFAGAKELAAQIRRDEAAARAWFR